MKKSTTWDFHKCQVHFGSKPKGCTFAKLVDFGIYLGTRIPQELTVGMRYVSECVICHFVLRLLAGVYPLFSHVMKGFVMFVV